MKFNPTKCEVMRISHNKNKRSTHYNISGNELRNVSNYKDLGVIMASDLKWSKHVEQIVHKANRVLGLLKRTVGGKNKDIFSNLYKTLVCPILEYACPVWSPHLAKDIHEIEKIQRRASRIALNQRRQEYECLLNGHFIFINDTYLFFTWLFYIFSTCFCIVTLNNFTFFFL